VETVTAAGAHGPTLRRARNVDAAAFASLVELHDQSLRRLAFRLLGDLDAMDDVLQEAYVKAFRSLPRFRGGSTLGTWLYRIVYNACLDELRRVRASRTVPLELEAVGEASDPAVAVVGDSELGDALASLPPEQRAVVLLVDAEGFDYRAAADVLGVEVGTVASRLNRARTTLRRALTTTYEGADES
jgi:RNA polymerase sigma-70 factor (ECF subfamily)